MSNLEQGFHELLKPFAMSRPCPECPWRTDVPVGRFPPERYATLKSTCEQGLDNAVFACHKSNLGEERACAGFLLVEGQNNLRVRLAMIGGRLRPSDISAAGAPLYASFEAMAEANGLPAADAARAWDRPSGLKGGL